MNSTRAWFAVVACLWLPLAGCGAPPAEQAAPGSGSRAGAGRGTPAEGFPEEQPRPDEPITEQLLHERLGAGNPRYNGRAQFAIENGRVLAASLRDTSVSDLGALAGLPLRGLELTNNPVSDLSPLRDMPLEQLFLEQTLVEDLTPLRGMPLQSLYASGSPVRDLKGLEGAPLVELNLVETRVRDISPLQGAPLEMLWLNDSPVESIAPLRGSPLVSLTIKGTRVGDLTPVRDMPRLERLHIAETPVADLTPLRGLRLTRLVFTPANIEQGWEAVRAMPTLRELGTAFGERPQDTLMPPAEFWELYGGRPEK